MNMVNVQEIVGSTAELKLGALITHNRPAFGSCFMQA